MVTLWKNDWLAGAKSYATIWRDKTTPEAEALNLSDEHALYGFISGVFLTKWAVALTIWGE